MQTSGIQTTTPRPLSGEPEPQNFSTPEQRERATAVQKWRESLPPVLTPSQIAHERKVREEAAEAARKAEGDPRERLRNAHTALRDCRGTLRDKRAVLARAEQHLEQQRQAAVAVEQAADHQVQGMVAAFQRGEIPSNEAPKSDAAVDVTLAERARDALAGEVAEAERAELAALRSVEQAAQAVIIDRGMVLAEAVSAAAAHLAALRQQLAGIDRIWINGAAIRLPPRLAEALGGISGSAGGWDQHFRRLIEDPEAVD